MPFNKGHIQALRNYVGKLFSFLPRTQKAQVESALVDVDNMSSFTSMLTSSDILARVPETFDLKIDVSGQNYGRTPVFSNDIFPWVFNAATENIVYGGLVTWTRQDDPRIDRYEIQIANNTNFADAISVETKDFQYAFSGITTTKYVRVRGVRADGTMTNWSDTVSFTPKTTDLRVHSFPIDYVNFFTMLFMTTVTNILVTNYYSHQTEGTHLVYTPVNGKGTSFVWASALWGIATALWNPLPPYQIGRVELVQQMLNTDTNSIEETSLYVYPTYSYTSIDYAITLNAGVAPIGSGPFLIQHKASTNNIPFTIHLFWRVTNYYNNIDTRVYTGPINVVEFGL